MEGYRKLDKTVFELKGNVTNFIQKVTSNDVTKPMHAFLDRNGKVIALAYVAIKGDTAYVLIETPMEKDFITHISPYLKLSKIDMKFSNLIAVHIISKKQLWTQTIALPIGYITLTNTLPKLKEIEDEPYTALRLENNIPLQGTDFDHPMFLETGLTQAVSLTKGCYPGQEIMARVTRLGKPARHLVRILYLKVPKVVTSQGKEVGKITSHAYSQHYKKYLAFTILPKHIEKVDAGEILNQNL